MRDFGRLNAAVQLSISDLQQAMASERTTCEQLANACLACIGSTGTHLRAEPTYRPSGEADADVQAHLAPAR